LLNGQPLLYWTIKAGLGSRYIDSLVLSTDDINIARIGKETGAEIPFMRPSYLAKDSTPGIDPILHCLEKCAGFDIVIVLQPTSPFRNSKDIDASLELLVERKADSCFSIVESKAHPNWMKKITKQGFLESYEKEEIITRRQELPPIYQLNGAIYTAMTKKLLIEKSFHLPNSVGYIMPKQRSIDIDSELDFTICEALFHKIK
ncbi:acylneuraminate cytidylyltransferase family protein, partial [Verrucomicrobia bacterium]|nr:acylneuraminate cytidylyltransferase family protein [Verrucomicrobiota bacterium]